MISNFQETPQILEELPIHQSKLHYTRTWKASAITHTAQDRKKRKATPWLQSNILRKIRWIAESRWTSYKIFRLISVQSLDALNVYRKSNSRESATGINQKLIEITSVIVIFLCTENWRKKIRASTTESSRWTVCFEKRSLNYASAWTSMKSILQRRNLFLKHFYIFLRECGMLSFREWSKRIFVI